ncbi:MAG: hypothetical protein ASARMPRED_005885 [Alectoria sarmentosa]|nr:MAG: hypothetical protein ASARMPRED_005885 [Alectoria sarmentosa]
MRDSLSKNGGDGRSDYLLHWLDADTSDSTANDGFSAGDEDEQGFVARLYQACLRALQNIYRQERFKGSSRSRSSVLRESLGKFYLWGEPFGVGELDRALQQSDELRDNVLERLGHIGRLLLRAPSIPPSKALSQQRQELESIIKQGKLMISEKQNETPQDGHNSDEEHGFESEGSSDSGSYDTFEDIAFTTTCLVELGPSLEQNLKHAENVRAQQLYPTSVPFSVSGPAMIYVSLVRERFKQAHSKLVERLGEANWQRHKSIREKMESTEHSMVKDPNLARETGIACSVFRPYSDFHDSGIGTSVPAPTECLISNVKNRVDWKMHVFADLKPYICTFSDCRDELAQFTTRAAWADHEFTEHRIDRTWECPECSRKLISASDWEQHLQEMHRREFTGPQLHVARNIAYETHSRPAEAEECPLCCVVLGKPRRAFIKHIGRHMEEIALMALPRNTEEDSDESSISTDQISLSYRNDEMPAVKAGLEVPEEMSHHQIKPNHRAIDFTTTIRNEVEVEVTRCICGNQEWPGLPVSYGYSSTGGGKGEQDPAALATTGWFVQCDGCKVWQHGGCVGIMYEATCPEEYFCEQCGKDLHKITTTVDGRKCSLYLPIQQSHEKASGQEKIFDKFFVGTEVAYKLAKPKEDGSRWIQCNITSISEVGNIKLYVVQDPEPDENGVPGQVYKATAAALIAIPGPDASPSYFYIGSQVLARYPKSTAFYRAEVTGENENKYRLKFEDDADRIVEVERRFVLAVGVPPDAAALNAAKLLNDNGINVGNLTKAQFASFQQQNPATQHKSIQVYHKSNNVNSQSHTPPVSGGASFGTSEGTGPHAPMFAKSPDAKPSTASLTPAACYAIDAKSTVNMQGT